MTVGEPVQATETAKNRREALRAAIETRTHGDNPASIIRRAQVFADWLEGKPFLPGPAGVAPGEAA